MNRAPRIRPRPLPPLAEAPLVSILVANYNYAAYVAETVRSALVQTYPHLEVVVCDDGSTDASLDILRALAESDARVRLVAKENGGQASALNAAFAASRGEVVCILDADDLFEPDKVEVTVEAFRAHPDAGFLIHNLTTIDADGRVQGRERLYRTLPQGWFGERVLDHGGAVQHLPPASTLSLRRPIAEVIFPLDPAFVRAADGLIQRFAPLLTPLVAVDRPLMRYRIHGTNLSGVLSETAAHRRKLLHDLEALHEAQQAFVARELGPEAAARLGPVEGNLPYVTTRARQVLLEPATPPAEREAALAALRRHPGRGELAHGWFYHTAPHLPPRLAAFLGRLVYTENPAKRAFHALLRGLHGLRH